MIKAYTNFEVGVLADGTSTSVTLNVAESPFSILTHAGATPRAVPVPTAVKNLTGADSAAFDTLGNITFSWATAPALGFVNVTGQLIY